MNIAVDIGNSRLKFGIFSPDGSREFCHLDIPLKGEQFGTDSLHRPLNLNVYPAPITWLIAQTGSFPCEQFQTETLKERPHDEFIIVTRKHIPLKIDTDFPDNVGIDRLLAAFGATKMYGDSPMLIVDAGSAITVDVVQDQTFCGGAILPGLTAMSETYPKISEKLPLVPLYPKTESVYPGKNTKDAIRNGLYWGTIGAIRQFYDMRFTDAKLFLTGGDADYLRPGLAQVLPQRVVLSPHLVLEGIHRCFTEDDGARR